jgi:hypothetical protein
MTKLETTSAGNTIEQRKEGNGSGNSGAGGSSDGNSNGGVSSAGRDKEIGGGGKEGVLTYGWIGHKSGSGFSDLAPSILHYNWF